MQPPIAQKDFGIEPTGYPYACVMRIRRECEGFAKENKTVQFQDIITSNLQ